MTKATTTTYACDRCGTQAEAGEGQALEAGWTEVLTKGLGDVDGPLLAEHLCPDCKAALEDIMTARQ